MNDLSAPIRDLIRALARRLAEDYLRGQSAQDNDAGDQRPNPAPLPDVDQAA